MNKEAEYFIENLSMLLNAGMGIVEAVESMHAEMRSPKMRRLLDELREEMENGSPLWLALEKTKLVASHAVSLIRIGEESGRLSENLKVVSTEQQKERLLRSKLKSAMMYPVLVLILTLVIGTGIAWFILPRLATVFAQLKLQLPLVTRALIAIGNFLGQYGHIAIPAFLAVVSVAFYVIFILRGTKFIGEWIIFRLPVVKGLVREIELARLGYILGTLLKAGLTVNQALGSLSEVTSFVAYRRLYAHLRTSIEEGNSFQKSFAAYGRSANRLIPLYVQNMIVSGQKSGNLSEVFLKFGQVFEEKTETTAKNLTPLLEPVLLIIVWLGVVGVALAIILPIYSLIGGLNK